MLQWIPQPQTVRYTSGYFDWKRPNRVRLEMPQRDERLEDWAQKLLEGKIIESVPGKRYCLSTEGASDKFVTGREAWAGKDGYSLSISAERIVLLAGSGAGLFYGMHTLAQAICQSDRLPAVEVEDWPDFTLRCAHYDLRQTHPSFEQLFAYISVLASYKYNTLLIEYEDKFPFEEHPQLQNTETGFTRWQIEQLREEARRNFMEILPLQQTFGHLEYVLKHPQYRWLRITPESVGEMCSCRDEAYALACALLDEMAKQHPDSRYLHLGCDEVWSLSQCIRCKGNMSRERQFITFVNRLVEHVVRLGKIPLIWHDMLMKCTEEELDLLDKRCVVVIWTYLPEGSGEIVRRFAPRLARRGIRALAAPAVRCFDEREIQNYPVLENRLKNIDSMVESASECGLEGVIVTNWTAAFSLGCPYGVYETSWYPQLYAAQAVWNHRAERKNFTARFFQVFHGFDLPEANVDNTAYVRLLVQYGHLLRRNGEIAGLLTQVLRYEKAMFDLRVLYRYLYRLKVFPGDALETQCIRARYRTAREQLDALRQPFTQEVERFLPQVMAKMYVCSRFYLADFLDEEIYAPLEKQQGD